MKKQPSFGVKMTFRRLMEMSDRIFNEVIQETEKRVAIGEIPPPSTLTNSSSPTMST